MVLQRDITHWGQLTHIFLGKLDDLWSRLLVCRLIGTNPLCDQILRYCLLDHWKQISLETNFNEIWIKLQQFHTEFYHIASQTVVFLSPPQCGKTWLQVLKHIFLCAAYMRHWIRPALVRVMACRLFGSKPLSNQMLGYCHLDHKEHTSVNFPSKYKIFRSWKCIWISRSPPSMTCAVWDINSDISELPHWSHWKFAKTYINIFPISGWQYTVHFLYIKHIISDSIYRIYC